MEGWGRIALTGAAAAFERVVGLDRERSVLLILRVSRGDPPSVRSLRRPVDEVLAFAA